jgi:hypothetical protein
LTILARRGPAWQQLHVVRLACREGTGISGGGRFSSAGVGAGARRARGRDGSAPLRRDVPRRAGGRAPGIFEAESWPLELYFEEDDDGTVRRIRTMGPAFGWGRIDGVFERA